MSAFNGNKIEKLIIPDSVTTIEKGAFTLNEISDLKLSNSLKTVTTAFGYNKLTSVVIPEGVEKIESLAFSDNNLTSISLPNTIKYLAGFNNNDLTSVVIPESVVELGDDAFARNQILSVTIPGNVKKIGKSAFRNTWHEKLITSVVIEEGVEEIGSYAFSGNHIKEVDLPSTIKSVAANSFYKNLGYDGIVHLYTSDFKNPLSIKDSNYQVVNPGKVAVKYKVGEKILKEEDIWINPSTNSYFKIGDKVNISPSYSNSKYELIDSAEKEVAISDKENEVVFECRDKEVLEDSILTTINKVESLAVEFGTSEESVLSRLAKETTIIDSNDKVYTVGLNWSIKDYNGDVSGECVAIGTFNLPEGVVKPDSITSLSVTCKVVVKEDFSNIDYSKWTSEDFSFEGTAITGLSNIGTEKLKENKHLYLPSVNLNSESITYIKEGAFKGLGLASVYLPKVTGLVVGANAFENNSIASLYIPEGIAEIDTYAFNQNDLKVVDFPSTLKKIGNRSFANNVLVSANFSDDIEGIAIDGYSFENNQLTSVKILKKVRKIAEAAFINNPGYKDGKVYIYTLGLDPNPDNNIEWHLESKFHHVVQLDK